jgi:hypothetical protein
MLATALFGTVIAGVPAVAQAVNVDYDHTINFLKFKSYTVQKVHATDPAVESRSPLPSPATLRTATSTPRTKIPTLSSRSSSQTRTSRSIPISMTALPA